MGRPLSWDQQAWREKESDWGKNTFLRFFFLLRYFWRTTFCKFKVWNILMWYIYLQSTCNAGDLGLIPGVGRSLGEGKGYPLQYSGLENSIDCIVHGVAKSRTRWATFTIIVAWGNTSTKSHNYHFLYYWEQLRSSLLVSLIFLFIVEFCIYNHCTAY